MFVIFISLTLFGCPARTNIKLENRTAQTISYVYPNDMQSEILSNKTSSENYSLHCLEIISNGEKYYFSQEYPPTKYYKKSIFSTSINGYFWSGALYLTNSQDDEVIELDVGCSDWRGAKDW